MRRFLFFIVLVVICIGSFLFYRHHTQQHTVNNQQMFEVVMAEKMRELYRQAQDWSTPVQLDVHDERLSGDYQVMSEFLLNYWMHNTEARNQYLRDLKAEKWDTFLEVERLDQDRKQGYKETEQMLQNVRKISNDYAQQRQKTLSDSVQQAKDLAINPEMRQQLQAKLENNLKADLKHDIFLIEQQLIDKAQAMFDMLKKYQWQRKDKTILFYDDKQVKKFNALYQDVLKLNHKMENIKKNNTEVLDEAL